jgi:Ca-activated chloride channel family protein
MTEQTVWLPFAAAATVFIFVLATEMLHTRRVRRVAPLAFGPEGAPRGWVKTVVLIRAVCVAGISWALLTLLPSVSGNADDGDAGKGGEQHVALMVDVSPSMDIKDGGPDGMRTRRVRVGDVVSSLLDRMGKDVSYTVACFYTGLVPMAKQAHDKNLVRNVFEGLPLGHVMPPGKTDLGKSIHEMFEMIKDYPEKSVTLVVCTDGDSKPVGDMGMPPQSLKRVLLLGVGDTGGGTAIDGHMSRQEAAVLRGVGRELHGKYFDVNHKQLASAALGELCDRGRLGSAGTPGKRVLALWMLAVLSVVYALLSPALEYFGSGWRIVSRISHKTVCCDRR